MRVNAAPRRQKQAPGRKSIGLEAGEHQALGDPDRELGSTLTAVYHVHNLDGLNLDEQDVIDGAPVRYEQLFLMDTGDLWALSATHYTDPEAPTDRWYRYYLRSVSYAETDKVIKLGTENARFIGETKDLVWINSTYGIYPVEFATDGKDWIWFVVSHPRGSPAWGMGETLELWRVNIHGGMMERIGLKDDTMYSLNDPARTTLPYIGSLLFGDDGVLYAHGNRGTIDGVPQQSGIWKHTGGTKDALPGEQDSWRGVAVWEPHLVADNYNPQLQGAVSMDLDGNFYIFENGDNRYYKWNTAGEQVWFTNGTPGIHGYHNYRLLGGIIPFTDPLDEVPDEDEMDHLVSLGSTSFDYDTVRGRMGGDDGFMATEDGERITLLGVKSGKVGITGEKVEMPLTTPDNWEELRDAGDPGYHLYEAFRIGYTYGWDEIMTGGKRGVRDHVWFISSPVYPSVSPTVIEPDIPEGGADLQRRIVARYEPKKSVPVNTGGGGAGAQPQAEWSPGRLTVRRQ